AIRPDAPPALEAVVSRATARSPDDRYATAAELAQALSAAVTAGTAAATRPAAAPAEAQPEPSEPTVLAAGEAETPLQPTAAPQPPAEAPAAATVPAAGREPAPPTARHEDAPTTRMPRRRGPLVAVLAGAVVVAGAIALV